jgi:predicted enzyme related to lactoylglutathione lyase
MTINHLNLIVTDVTNAMQFFETYFNFKCAFVKGKNDIVILKNSNDFTLVIMTNKNGDVVYPKNFHIGFMLDNIAQVDTLYEKLLAGKISVTQAPQKIRDSYAFYFYFDKLFIEVGSYL